MIRKLIVPFLVVLMSLMVGGTALAAPSTGQLSGPGAQGKGAATGKIRATYDDSLIGHTVCTGARVDKSGGTNNQFVKDSFTCTFTNLAGMPAGTYTGNPVFTVPSGNYVWDSDYDGQQATSVTMIVTDNGDGTGTLRGEAYYPV